MDANPIDTSPTFTGNGKRACALEAMRSLATDDIHEIAAAPDAATIGAATSPLSAMRRIFKVRGGVKSSSMRPRSWFDRHAIRRPTIISVSASERKATMAPKKCQREPTMRLGGGARGADYWRAAAQVIAWTNGFVERMSRALLDECFRVQGRKTWYIEPSEIQRDLDTFVRFYNLERSHQDYRLKGRTPAQALREALRIEALSPVVPEPEEVASNAA